MSTSLMFAMWAAIGLIVGGLVGVAFGRLQDAALRRHQRLEQTGKLNTGWAIMPGAMSRVAGLLIALAVVQYLFPVLFSGPSQWWVSAGVVGGYGFVLFRQLRQRLATHG